MKGNHGVEVLSTIIGWSYFVTWGIAFYPQVYKNWNRKSVVGLSFDYVALNIIGFFMYSLFNCSMYWCPTIKDEYFMRHRKGVNPVHLDDVAFSLHATTLTCISVLQCCTYERGGQKLSMTVRGIISVIFTVFFVSLTLPFFNVFDWLEFIYICSYIKLAITIMKYIPQAIMNFKRKSTSGFSIGQVLLDLTGGVLSMTQMIINSANYEDWGSIFGDPTKFGLGLFSVIFDIFFIIQHFVLYRPN